VRIPPKLAVVLGPSLVRALSLSWRFRLVTGQGTSTAAGPQLERAIYALWHAHLLPLSCLHRDQGATVLISRHHDGQLLARCLTRFGYHAVSGLSGRGGAAGLREMIRWGRAGNSLAFTPDGPRGPARRSKPGVIVAAAETGLPIIPAAAAARRAWHVRSWDAFLVPEPGAIVRVAYGEPLWISAAAADDPEPWLRTLDAALEAVTARCEAACRRALR